MNWKPTALFLIALAAGFAVPASAGAADDIHGSWAGSHVETDPGPPPGDTPSQTELDARAAGIQLAIDGANLVMTTPAGELTHPYSLVDEDASTVTVETALGAALASGGAPRTLVIELVDADTLRLRVGSGDAYLTVLTRQ